MRFSISQLLLLFPAWIIAFIIGPFLVPPLLVTWKHDRAANDIRNIRMWAMHEIASYETKPSFADFDQKKLASDFNGLIDPWGNPYQVIELEKPGLVVSELTFHAYSFGVDGASESNGNDSDDINSWDYDRDRHYGPMIRNDDLNANLWRTLWLTPIIYLVLAFAVGRFTRKQRNAG